MASFLFAAAGFVLMMVALGLFVILQRPAEVDHMMAAQLLGTGGVAILLLLATATDTSADRGCCIAAGAVCCVRGGRVRQKRVRPESKVPEGNERRMKSRV